MSHTIPLDAPSAELVGLIQAIKAGDEVTFTKSEQVVTRIVAATAEVPRHGDISDLFDSWKGKLEILDDSDDVILEHFKDYLP